MSAELAVVEATWVRRRWFVLVLVLVLTALVAGSIGWFAARHYDAAALDGAGLAARERCRAAVERELFRRSGQSARVDFVDIYVVGTDQGEGTAASVEGTATVVDGQGIHYGCSLYGYDSNAKAWSGLTMAM